MDALAYLADTGERRLPLQSFEMMMGTAWSRAITGRAVHSMARRGWIVLSSGMIVFTDEGHAAATKGIGVARAKKLDVRAGTRNRAIATRMPSGLF
jgi:hypothetical protein